VTHVPPDHTLCPKCHHESRFHPGTASKCRHAAEMIKIDDDGFKRIHKVSCDCDLTPKEILVNIVGFFNV
jgi:hypothetical protein